MPFLKSFIFISKKQIKQTNPKMHNVIITFGKEGRPENSRNNAFHYSLEKASLSASAGSLTIEAALAVPLFLFAAVCLIWLLEIQAIRVSVEAGMQEAGKRMAWEMYTLPVFTTGRIEDEIVKSIGADRMDRSLIEGGSSGVDCKKSMIHAGSKIMELHAVYRVRIPVSLFAVPAVKMQEYMRIKCWTGYVKEGFVDRTDNTIVYVTDTGLVYHKRRDCPYLDLSIKAVLAGEVDSIRNQSKGKYYPCEHCMKKAQSNGMVYVTNYGDRYHSSLMCSGLKRTIYAVPITEVKGKGACSKCGR